MSNDRYRLQTVLEIRRKARESATGLVALRREQLAEAEGEMRRREEAVSNCQGRIRAAVFQMDDVIKRGVAANKIVVHRAHVADLRALEVRLKSEVAEQELRVSHAQGELDKALETLKEAAKEVQAVEKHRDAWQETLRQQAERREQKAHDEISANNHIRQRTQN
ncbi:MAG TPA: flagellar FliJ family protein [Pyrinomonadaceae bacterium]|jgi:flagellar export protein FliJ|nr:flagellar FliJ family protein [Pyrinomonadaceae bacterium]